MTYQDAFDEACATCHETGETIAVVHDPIGREDWETEEEAYGYCPEVMRPMIYRFATVVCSFRPHKEETR